MSETLAVIHKGKTSEQCRQFKVHLKNRLEARGLSWAMKGVDVSNGTCEPELIRAAQLGAKYLGALPSTYQPMVHDGLIPVGVFQMVANPGKRTPRQLMDAGKRMADLRARRKARKAAADKAKHDKVSHRQRAVNAFLARVGQHEQPMGSNTGPQVDIYTGYWGFHGVPWCGCSEGYIATKFGGVKGLKSDVASVAAIENNARAGHAPYARWGAAADLLPGSFLCVGTFGQHTAMKVTNLANGFIRTVAGNHNDAIGVADYSPSALRGGAAMNYPG